MVDIIQLLYLRHAPFLLLVFVRRREARNGERGSCVWLPFYLRIPRKSE